MSAPTPIRFATVSPVQWMSAFGYTPESDAPKSPTQSLPTQFLRPPGSIPSVDHHARRPRGHSDTETPTTSVTKPNGPNHAPTSRRFPPAIDIKPKSKRQPAAPSHLNDPPVSMSVSSASGIVDGDHVPARLVHRVRRTRRTQSRSSPESTSVDRRLRHQGIGSTRSSSTSSSLALVRPRTDSEDVAFGRKETRRERACKRYRQALSIVGVDVDMRAHVSDSDRGGVDPEPTVSSKSKYFADALVDCVPAESSTRCTRPAAWYANPGLYDDLMIMLRRLKPILVQESVQEDPWKVLIAVRLLNVTTGKVAIPVLAKILSRWPTPQDLACAPQDELVDLLRPLGLYNKRARWLREVSAQFLEDRRSCSGTCQCAPYLGYPGVGPYALDSLRIFCGSEGGWKDVMPRDKELVRYLQWRWAAEEGKMWYPEGMGVIGDVDVPFLITLVDDLAAHYDDTIGGQGYFCHFRNDVV